MNLIILCTIVYILFFIIDFIPLYKSEKSKVVVVYLILFISSYILQLLIKLNVDIPSPAEPIKKLVSSIFRLEQ